MFALIFFVLLLVVLSQRNTCRRELTRMQGDITRKLGEPPVDHRDNPWRD